MIIKKNYVLIGKLKILLDLILMDVKTNIDVILVMAGRNSNIIQEIIKLTHVNYMKNVKNIIVHIIILNKIKDILLIQILSYFQKIEEVVIAK